MEETKATILVIDDDPLMLHALTNILSPNYNIIVASSGETGLEYSRKHDIDIILLDVVMKTMSGYEVLRELKNNELTAKIPVIFITGISAEGSEAKALSSGAVDFIRKPIVPEVVKLRVGLHLQLISQIKKIERFSLTDGLTGVNNRRCFDQQVEVEWNRAARNNHWLSMMMLDIDHFKLFNDSYGHLNGDTALKTLAKVLTNVMRSTDHVFRWGGEEFAIILPDTPLDGAYVVADKTLKAVATTPIICSEDTVYITVSIGVYSVIPTAGSYPKATTEFFETLDKALYRAKNSGKNKVVIG